MRPSISIASYLLKDIFWRWREQPGNVLTRFAITYVLVFPSLALLGGFVLVSHNLEEKLQRTGIDLLFITEHVPGIQGGGAARCRHPRLECLKPCGEVVELHELFGNAKTALASPARIAAYPDSALGALDGLISAAAPMVYLSDSLPAGTPVRVELDRHFFNVPVQRPAGMVGKFFQGDAVLVPEGMLPRLEGYGFSRVTLFKARDPSSLGALQETLRLMARLDRSELFLHGSTRLLDEFNRLKSRQLRWRFGLAFAAGGVLALVLGTLAMLEYRQRAYVVALLRSFGVHRAQVFLVQLLEGMLVVNLAGMAAYGTLIHVQRALYASFSPGRFVPVLSPEELQAELWLVFGCINLGALLATLPAVCVLRREIGTILS